MNAYVYDEILKFVYIEFYIPADLEDIKNL